MNDPIEDRLRADAARRHEVRPPSFDGALDAAISGGKSRRHVTLTTLGVAASVLLVAGLAFGLSGKFGGGGQHNPAAASSVPSQGPVVDGVVIMGLEMYPSDLGADPKQVKVVVAKPGTSACGLLPIVTVVDESATTVHLSVVTHQRAYRIGTASSLPSAHGTPTDPGATSTVSQGGAVGGTCVASPDGTADLRAAVGGRAFYVNGKRFVVMDERNDAEALEPPDGYAAIDTGAIRADLSIVNKYADGDGGVFWISYGPPQDFPIKGSTAGRVQVNNYSATVSESSGQRWLTWTLSTGAVMQVYSRAAPPLSVDVMAAAARSVSV
jgi:hypothetical protein